LWFEKILQNEMFLLCHPHGKQVTLDFSSVVACQNVPILQNAIAFKGNHSNTMLPNMMVLAPLQKLKIKYELSYQSTTRLKYIDKFV
jgi:hypothetical protein